MGVAEILFANIGVLILEFILLIVVIWYLWYLNTNYQNDYDDVVDMIQAQNLLLLEIANDEKTDPSTLLPKRTCDRIQKRKK